MPSNFVDRVRSGETVLGLGNGYPFGGIIEAMSKGWDFMWIDGQHGQFTLRDILASVQAAEAVGTGTVVRIPNHDWGFIQQVGDTGCDGIMVPMVNDAAQAKAVARAFRFAPLGARSYGGRRIGDLYGRDYYQTRPQLLVAQVETIESVENVEAIAATEGIDTLFFGPDDMKVQLGIPINTSILEDERLQKAMQRTAKAAKAAGKSWGMPMPSVPIAKLCVDHGATFIVGGADILFLRVGAAKALTDLQAMLKGAGAPAQAGGSGAKSSGSIYGT